MKKILLSSAALVAFAGAAAADLTVTGDAKLGYNSEKAANTYWSVGLGVKASQELNNGWSASLSADVDIATSAVTGALSGATVKLSDIVFSISNDQYGLKFGDVDTARESFSAVTNTIANKDDASDFNRAESAANAADGVDVDSGILLTASLGTVSAALSAVMAEGQTNSAELTAGADGTKFLAPQITVNADLGGVSVGLFHAADDALQTTEITAITLGGTLGGVAVKLTAAQQGTANIFGLSGSYGLGDVTLYGSVSQNDSKATKTAYVVGAKYSANGLTLKGEVEDEFGTDKSLLEGSYDLGNGMTAYFGHVSTEGSYLAGKYDLGGGASFLVSYADGITGVTTDIGDPEYDDGITLELGLKF